MRAVADTPHALVGRAFAQDTDAQVACAHDSGPGLRKAPNARTGLTDSMNPLRSCAPTFQATAFVRAGSESCGFLAVCSQPVVAFTAGNDAPATLTVTVNSPPRVADSFNAHASTGRVRSFYCRDRVRRRITR